jgi:serine/threonine protein kinase
MRISEFRRREPGTADVSTANRIAAVRARRAAPLQLEVPLIAGWVTESRMTEGDEAQIFRVHHQDDRKRRPFVAKVLRPGRANGGLADVEELRSRLVREVVALRTLGAAGCPNIPHVVTFGAASGADQHPWYIMPYYVGGSMWMEDAAGGRWSETYRGDVDRVMEVAEALATTLAFMHDGARGCIHGEVIASNVLLTAPRGRPVLADFGRARLEGYDIHCSAHDHGYTGSWRPPEYDHGGAHRMTPASDIFMLGGLIYEALSGGRKLPPASGWPEPNLHERAEYSLYRDTSDPRVGAVAALLRRMLTRSPRRRLTAPQVARACQCIRTGRTIGGRALKDFLSARENVRRRPTPGAE